MKWPPNNERRYVLINFVPIKVALVNSPQRIQVWREVYLLDRMIISLYRRRSRRRKKKKKKKKKKKETKKKEEEEEEEDNRNKNQNKS